jgi:hypothetical protein
MSASEIDVEVVREELSEHVDHVRRTGDVIYLLRDGHRAAAIVPVGFAEHMAAIVPVPTHRAVLEVTRSGERVMFVYDLVPDMEIGQDITGGVVAEERLTADANIVEFAERRLHELGYQILDHGNAIFDLFRP